MLALVVVGRYIRASFCYAYRGPAPTGHSPSRRGTTASRAAQTQTQRATRMSGTTPRLSDYKHDVPSPQLTQPSLPAYKACAGYASRCNPALPDWTRDTSKTANYGLERATLLHLLSCPSEPVTKARIRKRSRYALFTRRRRRMRGSKPCRILSPANASFFLNFQITLTHLHRPCAEPCNTPTRSARDPARHLPR
jgi:hypothetical protein